MNIKNLSLSFGVQEVFDDVNLNIGNNEKVGVIGVNGAGKTTFFKVIMGLIQPDSGRIILENNSRIGLLPQVINDEVPSLNINVFDFIMSGRPINELNNELQNVYEEISKEQDEKILGEIFDYIKEKYTSKIATFSTEKIIDKSEEKQDCLFLLYLSDDEIKTFFQNHLNANINIAILPNENCPNAMRNYGVSKDIKESIEDAFNIELLSKIDLLKCNDFIAFNRVVIGDMHGMNRLDYNQNSRINKIKIFFMNFEEYIKSLKINCIRIDVAIDYNDSSLEFWIKNGFSKSQNISTTSSTSAKIFLNSPLPALFFFWLYICKKMTGQDHR